MKIPYAKAAFRERQTQQWFTGSPGALFESGTLFDWAVCVGHPDLDTSYILCDSASAVQRLATQLNVAYQDGSEHRARAIRTALGMAEPWSSAL